MDAIGNESGQVQEGFPVTDKESLPPARDQVGHARDTGDTGQAEDPSAKAIVSSVQALDVRRTRQLAQEYVGLAAAEVRLKVSEGPSTFASRVHLTVVLPPGCHRLELFYPTAMIGPRVVERSPVAYTELQVAGGVDRLEHHTSTAGGATAIRLDSVEGPVSVSMLLDGAFTKRVEDGVFETWQLGLGIGIPGARGMVLRLDHPSDIALRARVDNSEYHTLAQGVASATVRKTGFFLGEQLFLLHVYGNSDTSLFRSLSRLPLSGAFGLISAALMIALDRAGRDDLAATALAFAMIPPFAQVVSSVRPSYGSSDIRGDGTFRRVGVGLSSLYLASVSFAILTLTDLPNLRLAALLACYIGAGVLGVLGCATLLAIEEQFIPYHYCDGCMSRIYWRRRSFLETQSRRSLCRTCTRMGVPDCGWRD